MKSRPLKDKILVEQIEVENKTAMGIIIPDGVSTEDKPNTGIVVAVGPGTRTNDGVLHPVDVKVGDTIVYGKYAGVPIAVEGRNLVLMPEEGVLLVQ